MVRLSHCPLPLLLEERCCSAGGSGIRGVPMATLTEVRPHRRADLTRGATGPGLGCRCHGGEMEKLGRGFPEKRICPLRVMASPGESTAALLWFKVKTEAAGSGLVFQRAQLGPQEVAFLPLKTADSLPGDGACHPLATGSRAGDSETWTWGESSGRGSAPPPYPAGPCPLPGQSPPPGCWFTPPAVPFLTRPLLLPQPRAPAPCTFVGNSYSLPGP